LRAAKNDSKAGKSSLYVATELFSNEQIKFENKLVLDIWDLGGKLPHLWSHHFKGSQGIIFVIDENQMNKSEAIQSKIIKVSNKIKRTFRSMVSISLIQYEFQFE
jgi:signal recognition particle receptor subunit beta